MQNLYQEQVQVRTELAAAAAVNDVVEGEQPAEPPEPIAAAVESAAPDVSGPGWVIEIEGFHFQHQEKKGKGAEYVREHLVDRLENGTVKLPGPDGKLVDFTMKEMGILAPVEVSRDLDHDFQVADPDAPTEPVRQGPRQDPFGPRGVSPQSPATVDAVAYRFRVQFCWKQIPNRQRIERRLKQQTEAVEAAEGTGG